MKNNTKKIQKKEKFGLKDIINNKKILIIGGMGLVIIILVVLIIIINPAKPPIINLPADYVEETPTNLDYDNMDNAKLDDKGNKVCTAEDLKKEHKVFYLNSKKETGLIGNNVKIYGDKEKGVSYADIPVTNKGISELTNIRFEVILLNNLDIALLREAVIVESLKPNETYVIKLQGTVFDITNTKRYEVWIVDD